MAPRCLCCLVGHCLTEISEVLDLYISYSFCNSFVSIKVHISSCNSLICGCINFSLNGNGNEGKADRTCRLF